MLLPSPDNDEHDCSRLSDHPAPDVPESETMPRFYDGDDALPRCQGNADARNYLGNPDIRVPESVEREDGLCAWGAKEKQDADGDKEEEDANDRGNAENNEDTLEENSLPRAEKGAEGRKIRHVPGGTWLTKPKKKSAPVKRGPGKRKREETF
ncbi:hypothetical protein NDU88_005081 [Pleurodeles waltl]|uniref:Uncharacterized protein n=1 Tax=Pleurodeles waltl TaxID=8319 RepID=A0AAV7LNJ1_PLEWA|nr:hypothetical protein NDU88_005081 [Pleurodeles waltl]